MPMLLNNWLSLGEGLVFLAVGFLLIRFRVSISGFYSRIFGAMNTPLGDREARSSKPGVYLAVGIVSLCCGVGSILMGIFRHQWT
jgi:hypothetical protein